MRKIIIQSLFLGLMMAVSNQLFAQANSQLLWAKKVGATSFPATKKLFYVNDFGAVNDGKTINSSFIQKTIDACAKQGGGIVTFKSGIYVSGSVFLKTNVQLRIDSNVTILGSQNFDDYPEIDTRIAGIEMRWPAALINIIGAKNAAVTGKGIVNARGKFCWDKYWAMRKDYDSKGLRWIVDYDAKRVRTLLIQNSSDITLSGLTFKNAGFWTVQLLYSTRLTVDGIIIKNNEDGSGPSTDGIDVDSSTWVLIQNCDIDCNDDNFCLKAGRDWDGLRVNKPTEYVVIRKCFARRGAGLVTLGSETSGGIRHILATDLFARHTDNGLRIKSAFTRGGTIEDIYFQNSVMDS
ncbi:MAG: glycoside hydrolase family 28 protein, partial [Pedobacter sp.]|nr:glycoside hydrolase family 28 protein [Chitinophagaceae bacterium]